MLSHSINDAACLDDIRSTMRRHIKAALLESFAIARDLQSLDPDAVMQALWHAFAEDGAMADALSDALAEFEAATGDPVRHPRARKHTPNGAQNGQH